MTEITVRKVSSLDDRTLPVFAEVDRLMHEIGRRAGVFAAARGYGAGSALDDWLRAEREVCWPAAQLAERGKDFQLSIALPGYESPEIELTVTPREVIVHAVRSRKRPEEGGAKEETVCWSEFRSDDVYRRVELPTDIDVDHVKAPLRHGILHVTAPKARSVVTKIPIATAA
jgi:HSP20 family protein